MLALGPLSRMFPNPRSPNALVLNPREWWDEHWIHDRIMSKL
jgi:hypothetical protein